MNSIKVRILTIIAGFAVVYLVLSFIHYTLNYDLDWVTYSLNTFQLCLATGAGFGFIWLSQHFMNTKRVSKNYYAAENVYQIPKAPLVEQGLHPLEAELVCLINRYANWPVLIEENGANTLKSQSFTLWEATRSAPKATHLHRIIALSLHLCAIHCFKEIRKQAKPWQFWKQDRIKYAQMSNRKNNLSVQTLKHLPSFADLTPDEKNIVIQALTFYGRNLPINVHPTAKQILDFLESIQQQKGA